MTNERRDGPGEPSGRPSTSTARDNEGTSQVKVLHRVALCVIMTATALLGCGERDGDAAAGSVTAPARPGGAVILATTTSTQDSGLLDALLPDFESGSECRVKTVAVGSGEALALGARGDADVLLVHSPDAEEEFMAAGNGRSRRAVMHNDFVLLGPTADAARAGAAADAVHALRAIAAAEAPFASRADESGTHAKELSLWAQAGVEPEGAWYIETGQGMGETLTIAGQKQAYTLSDRATFLATKNVDLRIVSEGGEELLNRYHVIVVRQDGTNVGCARQFSGWITSTPVQEEIGRFGVEEYGEQLFAPDAAGR
jgi:tungstate transport system substrate-binding protein